MLLTLGATLALNAYYKAEAAQIKEEISVREEKINELENKLMVTSVQEVKEVEAESEISNLMFVDSVAYEVIDVIEITATAYCHCEKCCGKTPDHPAYGITRSGLNLLAKGADIRIVAADPRVLALGTKIYIEVPEESRDNRYVTEDYGMATVEDTGGAIKGNRIDIYFPTHQKALEWGVREVQVLVLVPVS